MTALHRRPQARQNATLKSPVHRNWSRNNENSSGWVSLLSRLYGAFLQKKKKKRFIGKYSDYILCIAEHKLGKIPPWHCPEQRSWRRKMNSSAWGSRPIPEVHTYIHQGYSDCFEFNRIYLESYQMDLPRALKRTSSYSGPRLIRTNGFQTDICRIACTLWGIVLLQLMHCAISVLICLSLCLNMFQT